MSRIISLVLFAVLPLAFAAGRPQAVVVENATPVGWQVLDQTAGQLLIDQKVAGIYYQLWWDTQDQALHLVQDFQPVEFLSLVEQGRLFFATAEGDVGGWVSAVDDTQVILQLVTNWENQQGQHRRSTLNVLVTTGPDGQVDIGAPIPIEDVCICGGAQDNCGVSECDGGNRCGVNNNGRCKWVKKSPVLLAVP